MRAIRGAITVEHNTEEEILSAAKELIEAIMSSNGLSPSDLVSVVFSVTPDLNAAFPAAGARQAGLAHVPLLDVAHMAVPGALEKCIRVLVHANIEKPQSEITHVYLREAKKLRPDLFNGGGEGLSR